MERQPVDSSSLLSVGYDPARRMLEVEFQNGSVYQYAGVPANVYSQLMNAPSLGRFFARSIRGFYSYTRTG